ncbi:MAG: hypothetical protein M3461_16550 [Pseudomonadota bacterium]|nr:hypothetical protein [Pseudomonadota bacterium]
MLPLTHRDDGLMFYKWMLAWFNAPTPVRSHERRARTGACESLIRRARHDRARGEGRAPPDHVESHYIELDAAYVIAERLSGEPMKPQSAGGITESLSDTMLRRRLP